MFPLSRRMGINLGDDLSLTAGVGAVLNQTPKPRLNSIAPPGGKTPKNKSNNGISTDNQLNTPNAVNRWVGKL